MNGNSASLAKTTRPRLAEVMPRERLFSMLDRGRRCPVIWVTGPPGSGKTTLVASYLENRKPDSLWYQVDRGDSDVATFFYYISTAIAGRKTQLKTRLPLFTDEYHSDLSAFTRRYFQQLYQHFEPSFVMVLDSYHEISPQSQFHDVVRSAAEEMPHDGCIIIISRSEPHRSMARMRANRTMEVISWNELRLSLEETAELVKLWGKKLSAVALHQLYEKTEGWAAGLVLMLGQPDSNGSVAELPDPSSHQLVFDYLAGEIFQKLDARTRSFLLKTAYISEMTADMAHTVTDEPTATEILNTLHRNYHFVSLKSGAPNPVYQYHPLLHDFLVTRLSETYTEGESLQLLRKTSDVLNISGEAEEAVSLLMEAQDWSSVTVLILEHATTMLKQGRRETLSQWLEELPDDILKDNPWFVYWQAACRFIAAPRESRIYYETAFNMFSCAGNQDHEGLFLSCSGVMDSILYELDDLTLLDRWIATLEMMLQENVELSDIARARVTASMFWSLMMRQPDHPKMEEWVKKAYAISLTITEPNLRLSIEPLVAISATYIGFFDKAKMVIDTMRNFCDAQDVTPLAVLNLKNVESMYYMFTARYKECQEAVREGLNIARDSGVHMWDYHILSNGVAGALGSGDLKTAQDLLREMDDLPERPRRLDSSLYHYYSSWDAMLRNDIAQAFHEQKIALKHAIESGCRYFEILCRLAMVQILVEYGDEDGARTQQRQLHAMEPALRNRLLDFMCLLFDASLDIRFGRQQQGLNALSMAMELGRKNGYMHFLWWQPDFISELCMHALEAGIEPEYVKSLIQKRGLVPSSNVGNPANWPWKFRVKTFGKFSILKDDQPLGILCRLQTKPMELLKAIIAFGGEDVPEEQIAASIWPRIDGDYAHRSLTTTLHRLRKMLGEDGAVILQNGRISLCRRYWWLDTWELVQVFEEIDRLFRYSPRNIAPEKVTTLAEKLFAIYHAPFMNKESDTPWHIAMQELLRKKFNRYMGDLGRYQEERKQWDVAIRYYQHSLEIDAMSEGFCRRLMLCYREIGRLTEAIETYESCRKILKATKNIEPSAETTAIYENLIHGI
jgi:ATP/maltotriose-dependent transcriptional regulator MalT/DNA-binding SARP family transcriptional activator